MISKATIKRIRALFKAVARREQQRFIIEGRRSVSDVLKHFPNEIIEIYAVEGKVDPEMFSGAAFPCNWLQAHEFKKISQFVTPGDVLAIVRMPQQLCITSLNGRYLYLDGIQDPGNMGTIIRSAHWFSLDGIIMSTSSADPFSHKVVQASMASILSVPLVRSDDLELVRQSGLILLAADAQGSTDITAHEKFVLAIGQEGRGLSESVRNCVSNSIAIKRHGNAESLNAAVAASILLNQLCS